MLKWMLIYIVMSGSQPIAINAMGPNKKFDDMMECFLARDDLAETVGGEDGYFPIGSQAVCVAVEVNE